MVTLMPPSYEDWVRANCIHRKGRRNPATQASTATDTFLPQCLNKLRPKLRLQKRLTSSHSVQKFFLVSPLPFLFLSPTILF